MGRCQAEWDTLNAKDLRRSRWPLRDRVHGAIADCFSHILASSFFIARDPFSQPFRERLSFVEGAVFVHQVYGLR
jgi:hypothetical protein